MPEPSIQNYKMVLSYDGTDYSGWQRQPDRRTIQGVLEDALFRITGRKIAGPRPAGPFATIAGKHSADPRRQ